MTLKELLDTNNNVIELLIDVRNDVGKLVDAYEIGQYVTKDRYADETHKERWKCIKKPMNNDIDSIRSGGGFNPRYSVVPKHLMEMDVSWWSASSRGTSLGLDMIHRLRVCLVPKGHYYVEQEKKKEEIDGQMDISSFL